MDIGKIADVHIVKNSLASGFGIRHTASGTLYNVSGTAAVQIDLRDGTEVRLGTDEPETLAAALRRAIASNRVR